MKNTADERLIGDRCESVNRWLDELFRKFGPLHRFARHHWRGVDEAGKLFGPNGRKAAVVHILKDCGHVPTDREWKEQKVDSLGFRLDRPQGMGLAVEPTGVFNGYWDPKGFNQKAQALLDAESH